tara:strand:- start:6788 stop:6940 length:153 start_codon:yes stop_codon:yes gene_type:complete
MNADSNTTASSRVEPRLTGQKALLPTAASRFLHPFFDRRSEFPVLTLNVS